MLFYHVQQNVLIFLPVINKYFDIMTLLQLIDRLYYQKPHEYMSIFVTSSNWTAL